MSMSKAMKYAKEVSINPGAAKLNHDQLDSFARGQWRVIVALHPLMDDLAYRDAFLEEVHRRSR